VKVLVVDDHAVVRDGLRRLLVTLPNVEIFDAATRLYPSCRGSSRI
jgi:DNA-binding NarL/FixJ family response regulator